MTLRAIPDDASDVPDLPSLIRSALDAGDTLQTLESKSGGVVKYQRWGQLSKGQRLSDFPEPRTLAAIARGLGITETQVVISTARALGMNVSRRGSTFAHRLPADVDQLPLDVQSKLIELVRAIPKSGHHEGVEEIVEAAYDPGIPPGSTPPE